MAISEMIPFATEHKYRVRVYHADAACGCCGHIVQLKDDGGVVGERIYFGHPSKGQDKPLWAREAAEETIPRYWPESGDSVDWTKLDANRVMFAEDCECKSCGDEEKP